MSDMAALGEIDLPTTLEALTGYVRGRYREARLESDAVPGKPGKLRHRVKYGPRRLSGWRASEQSAWAGAAATVRAEELNRARAEGAPR